MTNEDKIRMEQDRRIREVREKQYEVWEKEAEAITAQSAVDELLDTIGGAV